MEFWRYYRIIRRRRWLIILGMVVCIGAVEINNYLTEQLYTGRTTVMESKGMSKEAVPLYPEQYLQLDLQLRLANLGTIAMSQRVMKDAAETLNDLGTKLSPLEILQHTSVQPVRDTNILGIEVTLPDPDECAVAADVVATAFKNVYKDLNNKAVVQSREFVEAQVETTRQAMVKAQNALREFKQKNQVVQIDQQSVAAVQRLAQAKTDYNGANAAYLSATARMARAQKELEKLPEWQTVGLNMARNPQWERLTEELAQLETQKQGMVAAGRGPKHPDVLTLTGQIDDVKNALRKTDEQYLSGKNEGRSQIFASTLDRFIGVKVEQVGADAQRVALARVIDDVRSEWGELPAKQAKLAELQADEQAATETYSLMMRKRDEARITEEQAKNEVALRTIDPVYVFPVNQRRILKFALAILLSPLLGIGVAFLLHYMDNTVKTAADAEKLLELPVHSVVPGARAHSLPRQKCPEIIDVAYQMLTSRLWIANQNEGINSFVMVSAEPDVGRSVTASNLAVALAREGARVVLVDADMRQPTQHLIFGLDNKAGLVNLLSGAASLEDVLAPTKVQGLLVVPTGPVPDNPVKLLRSAEMKQFVDQIKDLADFVVYDTPAGVAFPDPVLVASQVGTAIVVHSAGRVPRGSEQELRAKLESVGVRLIGAVLNKVRREDSSGYFHYQRSYGGVGIAQLPGGKKMVKGGA